MNTAHAQRAFDYLLQLDQAHARLQDEMQAIVKALDNFDIPRQDSVGGYEWSTIDRVGYAAAMYAEWRKEHPHEDE